MTTLPTGIQNDQLPELGHHQNTIIQASYYNAQRVPFPIGVILLYQYPPRRKFASIDGTKNPRTKTAYQYSHKVIFCNSFGLNFEATVLSIFSAQNKRELLFNIVEKH